MNAEYVSKLEKQFADAVKAQIGGNKDHGWGADDSMAVIDQLIAENVAEITAAKGLPEELSGFIKGVINPSQCRQRLESKKILNKSTREQKMADIFGGF
jgi:hypothetical protein